MTVLSGRIREKAFGFWLHWQSRPSRVYGYLRSQRITRSRNLEQVDPARIRVAAVQMQLRPVKAPEEYAALVLTLARSACDQGAQLVVFPEDVALHLLGFLPGVDQTVGSAVMEEQLAGLGEGIRPVDLFAFIGPTMRRIYNTTFSSLARALGVYIVAGSGIFPERRPGSTETDTYNIAHFYGPDGRLLGTQEKTHLLPMEKGWGLATGERLEVFPTPLGVVAAPVCMDAAYYETFRILSLLGAEIVALPVANSEGDNFWGALRGIWSRVQESQVYGIKSCLVGDFFGLQLTGKSGIYAPLPLTGKANGVLAELAARDGEGVVVADLDLTALRRLRLQGGLWEGFNPDLYERYFPHLYHQRPVRREEQKQGQAGGGRRKGKNGRKGSRGFATESPGNTSS